MASHVRTDQFLDLGRQWPGSSSSARSEGRAKSYATTCANRFTATASRLDRDARRLDICSLGITQGVLVRSNPGSQSFLPRNSTIDLVNTERPEMAR